MKIELKQSQIQDTNTELILSDIERENLSFYRIQNLPLQTRAINALEKENILTLADLISTPDKAIKGIRNIGKISFNEISTIKGKQIDELYKARSLQRPFPEDEETLSLLSKLKDDFSYFSQKSEESIWYDICRENLATPISNPFLSYEDLLSELLVISDNLLLLILWFKKLSEGTNSINKEHFNKKTAEIPHASLMVGSLKRSLYLIEENDCYVEHSSSHEELEKIKKNC